MVKRSRADVVRLKLSGRPLDSLPTPAAFQRTTGAARAHGSRSEPQAAPKETEFFPPEYLKVKAAYDVTPASRDAIGATGGKAGERPVLEAGPDDLFVFELSDGGTFVANPQRLQEALERAGIAGSPSGAEIDLDRLSPETNAQRGAVAALKSMIARVTLLSISGAVSDAILHEIDHPRFNPLEAGITWVGTKLLIKAIEDKLEQRAGLYRWKNNSGTSDDLQPVRFSASGAGRPAPGTRILVFVHGTASDTLGSFGHLCSTEPDLWKSLVDAYGEHIYGFEHRTLSESPIDNALALAEALPEGAQVTFVSHSRGGLVVDLLCLTDLHAHVENYAFRFDGLGTDDRERLATLRRSLDDAHQEQRKTLEALANLLQKRKFKVSRYARIASPANGTLLASGNFDVFLSDVLTLLQAVPYFFSSPLYWAFRRVVLEIARRRTDPHMVPGIEAMLPDSPLAQLLCEAPVQPGIEMAVIAGDSAGGNMLSRLRVALSDFVLFDKEDNDLVVDTPAMLAGIAPRAGARVLFEHGSNVSHFRYFSNSSSRSALREWLLADDPAEVPRFIALPGRDEYAKAMASVKDRRGVKDERRPTVVVLPDMMGSHLDGKDGRLWFPLQNGDDALNRLRLDPASPEATEIFDIFYGKLCEYLATSHNVFPFPYDWRQPLKVLGEKLAQFLGRFRGTDQPVRLLAHGMGGTVVRACIYVTREAARSSATHSGAAAPIVDHLMKHEGSRFIMLGTPNHGTHSVVADLLGKGEGFRSLWRLAFKDAKAFQQLLTAFAAFPGFLSLLPKRDFIDASQSPDGAGRANYFSRKTWQDMAALVSDRWFDLPCAIPASEKLAEAQWLFEQDARAELSGEVVLPTGPEGKSLYVFGVAPSTPCGIEEIPKNKPIRLAMLATPSGDGIVTWESGRLAGIDSYYYMPARHGDLASTTEHFPALLELLKAGATRLLAREAPVRPDAPASPLRYDAAPPTAADAEGVQRCLLGGSVRRRLPSGLRRRLAVAVRAMDLRFLSKPIMIGHYEQDPIAGPEALIDRELLGGDLSKRYNLGQYAGPRGSATVVLRGNNASESRARLTGAIVTGLGKFDGTLSASELTEAARVGTLRFLLQVVDVLGKEERELEFGSLLLGFNSSANLSASSSVEALVRGVVLANARFHETTGLNIRIAGLDIVEMYLDTAIGAAYALHDLGDRLKDFAKEHHTELEVANELISGEGARQRLRDTDEASYWPRIIVTDADLDDTAAPVPAGAGARDTQRIADRLRFMFIGTRARAETTVHQRQPNLIETLVHQQIDSHEWSAEFGRMLFQLMVPHDFKDAARQLDRLVLVVDGYTANLPWELMLAEGSPAVGSGRQREQVPLAVRTSVVRQLATARYRPQVVQAAVNTALVIGDPSVRGFREAFAAGDKAPPEPAPLSGAREEAESVAQVLSKHGYEVDRRIRHHAPAAARATSAAPQRDQAWQLAPLPPGEDEVSATNVLSALYRQPWRVLHISGHGVYQLDFGDGRRRSGVLLSDGLLITAAEIAAMEVVPELVFLNCCHTGQIDARNSNRLAASVASELIEIGVRCVLVAGWAVDDELAKIFGIGFYNTLLGARKQFGEAVFTARRQVWHETRRRGCQDLTWGAFQAYGDPGWMAEAAPDDGGGDIQPKRFVALEELLDALTDARIRLAHQRDAFAEHDGAAMLNRVNQLVSGCSQPKWATRPELHSALGATMRELNEVRRAYEELLCAVQLEDPLGRVPIRDIEQLADVEAQYGEQCCEQALASASDGGEDKKLLEDGERLIEQALERLDGLDRLTRRDTGLQDEDDDADPRCPLSKAPNCLRRALRGRVCRRMASVQARRILSLHSTQAADTQAADTQVVQAQVARGKIHDYLGLAIGAYRGAEGSPSLGYFYPDLTLNRLALEALDGEYARKDDSESERKRKREAAVTLARLCGQGAENKHDRDAASALLRAKGMLVEELILGGLGADGRNGDLIFEAISQACLDATTNITLKPSELDVIVIDLESLSRLFLALATVDESPDVRKRIATRLKKLARQLQPRRSSLVDKRNMTGLTAPGKTEAGKTY